MRRWDPEPIRDEEAALRTISDIYWRLSAEAKAVLLDYSQRLMIKDRESVEIPTKHSRRPKIGP